MFRCSYLLVTTARSDDEDQEKARRIEGMQFTAFWLDLWCTYLVEVWRESNIEDLVISMSHDLLDYIRIIDCEIFGNFYICLFFFFQLYYNYLHT